MAGRVAQVAGGLALQLIALVLAHDLAFLARFGSRYGEALAHAGHGETWSAAVGSSVVLAVVLAALATARLLQLHRRVRHFGAETRPLRGELREFLGAWLRGAIRIGAIGAVLLTVQENVERVSLGAPVPGPGILLSPEYPFGLWIVLAVGALVAFVAALFRHRVRVLLARLRTARRPYRRAPLAQPLRRRPHSRQPLESILGRRSGLRAPPLRAAA